MRARRLHGRGAGVVLGRHDEHAVTALGYGLVGERVTPLAATLEPDLDRVAWVRTGHHASHLVVVDGRRVVPRPALPLGRGCRLHRATVDAVVHRDSPEAPLGQHRYRLRIAIRLSEAQLDARVAALVGVVAVDVERLGRDTRDCLRIGGVARRVGHRAGERQVALELCLHQRLVVGEDEATSVAPLGQLRRPRQCAGRGVRVVGGLTVGDVEDIRAQARVKLGDRRGVQVAGHRVVDRVVRSGGAGLPALGVEQPLAVGVVVDLERETLPVEQADHRLRLRLRHRRGAPVGFTGLDGRRALLVIAPVVGEVAIGVDAVADLGLSVSVVVAEVLPPQPLVVERVLVAVGVGHEDEPELGRLQQLADFTVVGPPPVDVVVHQPPVDFGGDPFTACWVELYKTAGRLSCLPRAPWVSFTAMISRPWAVWPRTSSFTSWGLSRAAA